MNRELRVGKGVGAAAMFQERPSGGGLGPGKGNPMNTDSLEGT